METKVNVPEGYEIDEEQLKYGKIWFKPTGSAWKKMYDVFDELYNEYERDGEKVLSSFMGVDGILRCREMEISDKYTARAKVVAYAVLSDIAKYFNGNWEPDWNNEVWDKHYIIYDFEEECYKVINSGCSCGGAVYFRRADYAWSVIGNPNFRPILDTLFKQ